MGTLDKNTGSFVKRIIKIIDITGLTPTQMENTFNNTYGPKGWRIVQIAIIGTSRYLLAEREE